MYVLRSLVFKFRVIITEYEEDEDCDFLLTPGPVTFLLVVLHGSPRYVIPVCAIQMHVIDV
jgi:hypothetical protein